MKNRMQNTEYSTQEFIGKPYQAGGCGPDCYDCYGLAAAIALERGFELPAQSTPESVEMRELLFAKSPSKYLEPVESAQPWDLVVFDHKRMGLHIATMTDEPGRFIHVAELTRTVCIGHVKDPLYRDFIYGFYRLVHQVRIAPAAP